MYKTCACQYQRFAYDRYHLASRKLQHKFSLNRNNPFSTYSAYLASKGDPRDCNQIHTYIGILYIHIISLYMWKKKTKYTYTQMHTSPVLEV